MHLLYSQYSTGICLLVGNLLTTDPGGPYNFSLLNTQTTEVRGISRSISFWVA